MDSMTSPEATRLIDRKMAANTAVQSLQEDIISVVAPGYEQTNFITSGLSFVKKFCIIVAFLQTVDGSQVKSFNPNRLEHWRPLLSIILW